MGVSVEREMKGCSRLIYHLSTYSRPYQSLGTVLIISLTTPQKELQLMGSCCETAAADIGHRWMVIFGPLFLACCTNWHWAVGEQQIIILSFLPFPVHIFS